MMAVISSSVLFLIRRFPNYKDAIEHLAKTDDQFLTLCEDYQKCKEALSYWTDSTLEHAKKISDEYISLLQELENEILHNLEAVAR